MIAKLIFFSFLLVSFFLSTNAWAESPKPTDSLPQIALMDVASSSYDAGKSRLLTDIIRSELFKTHLFRIVDRGVIQKILEDKKLGVGNQTTDSQLLVLGKALEVQKIFVCNLEKFSDTIALNVRIVDVGSALLDYTENVFIKNENLLFDAIKEMVVKVQVFYTAGKGESIALTPEARQKLLESNWAFLGAKGDDLTYLTGNKVDTEEYLSIRQYDITFTPAEYVSARRAGLDMTTIKVFLQSGVSYLTTEKALRLGVTKLDKYKQTFQSEGYSVEDYLEAYEKNFSVEQYRYYRQGFRKDNFIGGVGGVADNFPIANSDFKFLMGQVGWEHFWTSYQRETVKMSTDMGVYLMNLFAPIPYAQYNLYVGKPPYYIKLSAGGHAEVLLGGHFGVNLKLGFEVLERFEVAFMVVPWGTEPKVSYSDFTTKQGMPGYGPIVFPYYGFMVTYKIPAPDKLW